MWIACKNIIDVKLSLELEFIDLVPRPRNFNDLEVFADGVRIMRIASPRIVRQSGSSLQTSSVCFPIVDTSACSAYACGPSFPFLMLMFGN